MYPLFVYVDVYYKVPFIPLFSQTFISIFVTWCASPGLYLHFALSVIDRAVIEL